MKKFTLFLFVFSIMFSVNAQKQTFKYSDTWGNSGFNLESQKSSGVEIIYSIKEFSISETEIKGETLQNINLPGIILFNDAGMPDLPGESKLIAVPEGAKPILKILDYRTETVEGVEMAPAPVIPFDTEPDIKYEKNMKVFSKDAFYPEDPFKLSEVTEIRGVDAVMLGITPFKYNPVTKQLIVYRDIKVEITFEGGTGYFGENRLRNRVWEPILDDALLNYSSLPKIDFDAKAKNAKDDEYEYVILTLDDTDFTDWAETIAEFRRKQGISTGVFTITSGPGANTVSSIETWVDNMYNTWTTPPAAVLILADYGTGSSGITSQSYSHPSPYSDTYITDNKYADVDEDDLPDIAFARITANNATQLEVMITKFIDNESNPPTNADFYNHPITALGWQDDRWFQICSEVIGGFWNNELGKETVRINELGTPANNHTTGPWSTTTFGDTPEVLALFGPDGLGYIPATPQELGGFTGGTATMVNNAINSGCFMLQHRDHGGETGWSEPDYDNSDIDGLTNTDLPFIWSVNCKTGRFDYSSECFAEKFHRYTYNGNNSGALGIIAASETSYSFVNDTYVWGCYDNMWPNFMPDETANPESRFIYPAFANIAGKNFLYQSSWPYNTDNKQITYRLFHHHGDPYLNVYSEIPQNLSVTCPSTHIFGDLTIDITVDDQATIAVTYYNTTDEETVILGTAVSSGGATTVNLASCPDPGTNMLVTITKQNYYRYTQNVLVIAPSGPYDVVDGFLINDGDNNEADFGETFNLDITVKNVGVTTSENITATLTTTDSYVTSLTNSTNVSYPNIAPDASETSSGNFTVELANNVPDQHSIQFSLEITDNSKATYTSTFSFNVNAPELVIGNLTVDDAALGNGDGILDPGETADIIIQTTNDGHADITNVIGAITSTSTDLILNTTVTSPTVLNIGQTGDFSFNVTADGATPSGTVADIDYTVTAGVAGQYSANETKEIIIGFVPEYCEAGSNDDTDEFIERVQFVDIDNTTTIGGGYNDYTHISTDVETEGSYPITITNGDHYSSDQMGCWVDWNYDGDFEDADESFTIAYSSSIGTGTVTVPADARIGSTTMRLRVMYTGTLSPCGNASYGEVEDYTLNVLPNGVYGGTASANPTVICVSGTTTLTLSGWVGDDMQWQSSPDGSTWSDISGAVSTPYTTAIFTSDTYFRAEVTMAGYDPAYSNTALVYVNDAPVAGTAAVDVNEICEGETVILSLTGQSGDIQWQESPDGTSWVNISGAVGTPYTTSALDADTYFRAEVSNPGCDPAYSNDELVTVYDAPVGGTASADETSICTGSSTTITLTGYTGDIQWQNSPDGSVWTDISGATSAVYITDNLIVTTHFRAVLSSYLCDDTNSSTVEITVVENPVAGYSFTANNQELTFANESTNATSYSWNFGDGNTSVDENPVHIYSESGTYTVTLTSLNGVCADDVHSKDIAVTFVGIEGLESGIMNIYPNPTNGIFNIESFGFDEYKLEVCDVNGNVIINRDIHEDSYQIDMSKYPKGIYFITVILENETKTGKLILK